MSWRYTLHHINNHEAQFKIHNTHSFIHTIHTTLRYIAVFSYLKPIHMHEKVKVYLKFCVFFLNLVYTLTPKSSQSPQNQNGWMKKGNNLGKND